MTEHTPTFRRSPRSPRYGRSSRYQHSARGRDMHLVAYSGLLIFLQEDHGGRNRPPLSCHPLTSPPYDFSFLNAATPLGYFASSGDRVCASRHSLVPHRETAPILSSPTTKHPSTPAAFSISALSALQHRVPQGRSADGTRALNISCTAPRLRRPSQKPGHRRVG